MLLPVRREILDWISRERSREDIRARDARFVVVRTAIPRGCGDGQSVRDDQQLARNVAQQMRQELDDCGLRIGPGNRRKQKFHQVTPAIADNVFQLKWYCSTGVCPRGAQVRQR